MKYFNICTKKVYTKGGIDKTFWLNAGTMRETDDGKRFIQLNHLPDVTFYVFSEKLNDKKYEKKVEPELSPEPVMGQVNINDEPYF